MEKFLTCPRGHRWDPSGSGMAVHNPACPVCGAPPSGVMPTADAATLPPRAAASSDTLQAPGSSPTAAASGSLPPIFGRYRIDKELGRGGMGAVYLAHDTQLERAVALKVPHFTPDDGPQILERFHREARTAATLQHANLCPVYDFGEIDGRPFLAMAFIEGQPLSALLRTSNKPLTMRQIAALVRKLAVALGEAHRRKVIHRDLKPANIMITARGEPVVMDFGLARRDSETVVRLTKQGTILGTPAYMAPEQARGDPDQMGPSCDIYSLGVILYELLSGKVPFAGDPLTIVMKVLTEEPPPPSTLRPNVDPRLEAICRKAMAKQPEARYASMAEFAAALNEYLEATAPADRPDGRPGGETAEVPLRGLQAGPAAPPAAPPPRPGGRWVWVAVGGIAVALSLGAVAYVVRDRGGSQVSQATQPQPAPTTPESKPPGPAPKPTPPPATPEKMRWPAAALREGRIPAPDLKAAKRLLTGDFRSPGRGWQTGKRQKTETGFRDGKYFVRTLTGNLWRVNIPQGGPVEDYAYEVVGRLLRKGTSESWGLVLGNASQAAKDSTVLRIVLAADGTLSVAEFTQAEKTVPLTEPIKHPKIKSGDAPNTLLVVVRDRLLEVYVNGFAVSDPIALPNALKPAWLGLLVGTSKGAEAEFERVTVWSAADLPPLASRMAAVK